MVIVGGEVCDHLVGGDSGSSGDVGDDRFGNFLVDHGGMVWWR